MSPRIHPAINISYLYINGLECSFKNGVGHISAGECRDDKDNFNMSSGELEFNPNLVGINGVDIPRTNSEKLYAIYLIGDSSGVNKTASILTSTRNLGPWMPTGYDIKRLIGYALSFNQSPNGVRDFFNIGKSNYRTLMLSVSAEDYPVLLSVPSYTFADLTSYIPFVDSTPVHLFLSYLPAEVGNITKVQNDNYYGQSVTVPYTNNITSYASFKNVPFGVQIGVNAGGTAADESTSIYFLGFDFCA